MLGRPAVAIVLVAFAISATGCSSSGDEGFSSPEDAGEAVRDDTQSTIVEAEGSTATVDNSSQVDSTTASSSSELTVELFLEAVETGLLTRDESALLYLAQESLIQRCMEQQGWDYHFDRNPVSVEDSFAGEFHRRNYDAWQWDAVEEAARLGYGISGTEEILEDLSGPASTEQGTYLESLSGDDRERYILALSGDLSDTITVTFPGGFEMFTATSGCISDARAELYGSIEDPLRATAFRNFVNAELEYRVQTDSRLISAYTDWSACMSDRGFAFEHPDDAYGAAYRAVRGEADPETARAEEIAVAVADAECNHVSRLRSIGDDVFEEVAARLLHEHGHEAIDLRALNEMALTRAADVVTDR